MFDAHVHMGYFPRWGKEDPYYYSPRRIFGALSRAGVDEFIVSSTNAVWDIEGTSMHAEAKEMKRLAGTRAHVFFWVSLRYLEYDPDLLRLPDGLYEGFKLHGGESSWLQNPEQLKCVLSQARERAFPVQIHTGKSDNGIGEYLPYCRCFPELSIDLAHGLPHEDVPAVLAELPHVYVDTAFVPANTVQAWLDAGADERRIMFGSDVPAPQRYAKIGLSSYLLRESRLFSSRYIMCDNAKRFLACAGIESSDGR